MQLHVLAGIPLLLAVATSVSVAHAAELVYRPLHPAFGGDPNNFNALLGLAQIQNQHTESSGSGGGGSAVPEINFPPITIDLGGVGDVAVPEVPEVATAQLPTVGDTDPVAAPQIAAGPRNNQLLTLQAR